MSDKTIKELRQRINVRVKEHQAKIDQAGRFQISQLLVKSSEPYQTVRDIQQSCSLNFPRAAPALSFLDVLQCSRSSVYQNLLENLKQRLETQLENMTDDKNLLLMLDQTIGFFKSGDLKQVPISIIKRLPNIPEKYLHAIARRGYLMDVPFNVRRKAWEINLPLFDQAVDAHCRTYFSLSTGTGATAAADNRKADDSINQLCECIGQSEKLFSAFADYCTSKAKEEAEPSWGRILRNVLTTIQGRPEKIGSLGKLNDLSSLLGHCIRQGKVDSKQIATIIDTIKFFIIAQFRLLLSVYDTEYQRVTQARAAYYGVKKSNVATIKPALKIAPKPIIKAPTPSVSAPSAAKRGRDEEIKKIRPSERDRERDRDNQKDHHKDHHKEKEKVPQKDILQMVKRVFEDAWKSMSSNDPDGIFAFKVSDLIAPDYSKLIKKPMDLGVIKTRIAQNHYTDIEHISEDFRLVFKNCIQYNVDNFYAKLADKLLKLWEGKKGSYARRLADIVSSSHSSSSSSSSSHSSSSHSSNRDEQGSKGRIAKNAKESIVDDSDGDDDDDLFEGALKKTRTLSPDRPHTTHNTHSSSSSSRPSAHKSVYKPAPKPPTPEPEEEVEPELPPLVVILDQEMSSKEAIRACFDAGWQYLDDIDTWKTFSVAVTEAMAPGYAKEIPHPMDLSTMKLKIDRRMYKSLAAMDIDVQQMFKNCITFDRDSSGYSDNAKDLTALWNTARGQMEKAIVSRESIGVEKKIEKVAEIIVKKAPVEVQENDIRPVKAEKVEEKEVREIEVEKDVEEMQQEEVSDEVDAVEGVDRAVEGVVDGVVEGMAKSESEELFGADDEDDMQEEAEDKRMEEVEEKEDILKDEMTGVTDEVKDHDEETKDGMEVEMKVDMEVEVKQEVMEEIKEEIKVKGEVANESMLVTEESSATHPTEILDPNSTSSTSSSSSMDVIHNNDALKEVKGEILSDEAGPLSASHPDTVTMEIPVTNIEVTETVVEVQTAAAAPVDISLPTTVTTSIPTSVPPTGGAVTGGIVTGVAPKALPPIPTAPPELPVESLILRQSCLADNYFKTQATIESSTGGMGGMGGGGSMGMRGMGGTKGGFSELPGVSAEGKLLWVICILRDLQVQDLLLRFLASHLADMLKSRRNDKKAFLPYEDATCKFAIQLCQLSLSNEHELLELDQSVLRVEIPMMMFDVLCSSEMTSSMTSSGESSDVTKAMTSQAMTSESSQEDSLESVIAKSASYKTHQEIAKHAVEGASQCRNENENQDVGDLSLRLNFCETIAKLLLEFNGK